MSAITQALSRTVGILASMVMCLPGLAGLEPAAVAETAAGGSAIDIKLAATDELNPLIAYRTALIRLAMQASGRKYTLSHCETSNATTSDLRYIALIKSGQACNVFVTSAGSRLTEGLTLIPFPIYLGGGGYRVLLANPSGLRNARSITHIEQLKKYPIGTGLDWVDTDILETNGFALIKGSYLNLFDMLKVGRFDYLNRSIFEAPSELSHYDTDHQLGLVPDLLLVYPEDLFFYTTPGRNDIRDSLLEGLQKIYRNGALAALIDTHPSTRSARPYLQSRALRVFRITNQNLPPAERKAIETYPLKWLKQAPHLAGQPL